jgi:hypothetical protein
MQSIYVIKRLGGKYCLHLQGRNQQSKDQRVSRRVLKMEVLRFSEISVHIRTTRFCIPKGGKFSNYRCENLGSYNYGLFGHVLSAAMSKHGGENFKIIFWI